jgi:hypothetical protein
MMTMMPRHNPTVSYMTLSISMLLVAALSLGGCGKKDPEENFNLWSNNQAGWSEMGRFVADAKNPVDLRARALEVLALNGHPSQVPQVVASAKDKDKVVLALRNKLAKVLKNPNEKMARYAKQVMFETIESLPEAEQAKTRKIIADWAFGDITFDDQAKMVAEKLGRRMAPEEIVSLKDEGVRGASIMLAKSVARDQAMFFLKTLNTEKAKLGLIDGLRRYHKAHKNVKVTEVELAAVQHTKHLEGVLYFMEIYEHIGESEHPEDKQASSLAIAAAMEWLGSDKGKKLLKDNWAKRFRAFGQRFLVRNNCDDRFWGAQVLVEHDGIDGLREVLSKIPDDKKYGQEEFAQNDVKMMITDFCQKDLAKVDKIKARELFMNALDSKRIIERIFGIRCLLVVGDPETEKRLKKYGKKDNLIVDPVIVPQAAEDVTVSDLAAVAYDILKYGKELDKLHSKGKISAADVKWRKAYAGFNFERRGKDLREYAESRANAKVAKDNTKAAAKKAEGDKKK